MMNYLDNQPFAIPNKLTEAGKDQYRMWRTLMKVVEEEDIGKVPMMSPHRLPNNYKYTFIESLSDSPPFHTVTQCSV